MSRQAKGINYMTHETVVTAVETYCAAKHCAGVCARAMRDTAGLVSPRQQQMLAWHNTSLDTVTVTENTGATLVTLPCNTQLLWLPSVMCSAVSNVHVQCRQ
jgi:hypothetical protein